MSRGEFLMKDLWWGGRRLATVVSLIMVVTLASRGAAQGAVTIKRRVVTIKQAVLTLKPSGWVGFSLRQDTSAKSYPILISVDPDSPAQKAGLVAGDTILSYEKQDARGWSHGKVAPYLVPGRKIAMRYRRNGVKETTITVEKGATQMVNFRFQMVPDSGSTMQLTGLENGDLSVVLNAPQAIFWPTTGTGNVPVAGASVTRMNKGLATTLGVANEGVFVINVMPDTPADRAGLQGGDVIIKVNKVVCRDPAVIVKALYESNRKQKRDVMLKVQRKGKPVQVVLR